VEVAGSDKRTSLPCCIAPESMNGHNKLHCFITLSLKCLPVTNTLAYWPNA